MLEYENKINNTFTGKAWAYKVMYHGVAIGLWDGKDVRFHDGAGFDWDYILELRIFNKEREIRIIRGEGGGLLFRDSGLHIDSKRTHPRCTAYRMYGTDYDDINDKWIMLKEERGGGIYFPKVHDFNGDKIMWLGICNYLRFTDDLRLEVCDYVFTGFKRGNGKQEVALNV